MRTIRIGSEAGRSQAWILSVMALMVVIPATASPPPETPPVPGAVRVIGLSPDNSAGKAGVLGGVVQPWLSDHEILYFRHSILFRYDAHSRTDTRLSNLTRQVMSSHCYLYFLDASPDGQQVVWGMSANGPLFVATLDGTRRAKWDGDSGMTEPHWCADGKHWLQFHSGGTPASLRWTRIQVNSLDDPSASETFPSPPPGLNGQDIFAAPSADEIVARTPDHADFKMPKPNAGVKQSDGTFSFTFQETPNFRSVQTISLWSLHQSQPLHRYVITLPGNAQEVAVSADGKRVAWLLSAGKSVPQSLWVSGLDGGRLHRIGVVRASGHTGGVQGRDFATQMLWVPGDERVSFLYGDALWTVPAD